jgi:adenylate cyclase
MRYNLACALTTDLNDRDRAIEILEPYFQTTLGVTHIRHAEIDPDLDPLRDDHRFTQMLGEARQRLGITT